MGVIHHLEGFETQIPKIYVHPTVWSSVVTREQKSRLLLRYEIFVTCNISFTVVMGYCNNKSIFFRIVNTHKKLGLLIALNKSYHVMHH